MAYLFDGITHDVSYNSHLLLLAEADGTANSLALHGGIPLWLDDVDAACSSEIQAAVFQLTNDTLVTR